jgi:hypothetical protein
MGRTKMTGSEKRDEIIRDIFKLAKKRGELESSTLSPSVKKSQDSKFRREMEKLIAVLLSPALAAICT